MNFLDKSNVCVLSDWPAQSPDLNIIENLWSILKYKVKQRKLYKKEEIWNIICDEFYAIDDDTIIRLYESIPSRLRNVREAKGFNTKY